MKFKFINATILVSSLCASSFAAAGIIAAKNDSIFLLGGSTLSVQLLSNSLPAKACTDQLASQPINPTATDIIISGSKAIVAPGKTAGTADVVDISLCLSPTHDATEAKANLKTGMLTIPCLNIDDTLYNVEMKQRGNSMNWEVEFGEPIASGSCIK
ncbi:MAG: hypothetical protein ACXWF8_04945 [Methylobacter sp.]